jgi:WD40 repeat protein
MPLIQFDVGSLMSKWVGESESNCRTALQQIEAMSPCVVQMDEVEKGFDSVGRDGDSAIVPLPWTLNPEGVIVWNLASNQFEDWELGELSASRADFISRDGQFAVGVSPSIDAADVRTAQSDSGSPLVILDLACREARAGRRFSGPYALGMTQENQPIMASRLADDLTRVEVRNLAQDQRMGELVGHTDSVYAIAYSPDGKRIATAGRDSLRLWDAQTFTEIVQMRGHTSFVWSLEFSPDGSVLASGSGDATIRIWDTQPKRGGPPL